MTTLRCYKSLRFGVGSLTASLLLLVIGSRLLSRFGSPQGHLFFFRWERSWLTTVSLSLRGLASGTGCDAGSLCAENDVFFPLSSWSSHPADIQNESERDSITTYNTIGLILSSWFPRTFHHLSAFTYRSLFVRDFFAPKSRPYTQNHTLEILNSRFC